MAPQAPDLATLFAPGPLIEQAVCDVMRDHPTLAPFVVDADATEVHKQTLITAEITRWGIDKQSCKQIIPNLSTNGNSVTAWTAYEGQLNITVEGCRTKNTPREVSALRSRNAKLLGYICALFGIGTYELNMKLPYYEVLDMWVEDGDSRREVQDATKIAWDVRGATFGFKFAISIDSFTSNLSSDSSSS